MVGDQFLKIGMKVQFFDRGLKGRQQAYGHADAASRLENIDSTSHTAERPRKIKRPPLQEARPLFRADQIASAIQQAPCGERFAEGAQSATNTHRCGEAWFQVQVAAAKVASNKDERFNIHL
jgi:hypothetical protein